MDWQLIWSAVVIGFGAKAMKSCHRFQMGMSSQKKRRWLSPPEADRHGGLRPSHKTFLTAFRRFVTAALHMRHG